jgi:cytochrome c1
MATEIAAKGDLIAGTGSQTFDNVTVGTNGTSLVADSAASTGLKWGFPTSLGCQLYKDDQVVSNATQTAMSFNYEIYDTSGFHDNTTNNSRITIPAGLGGKYLFNCQWAFQANAAGQRVGYLIIGGVTIAQLSVNVPLSAAAQANVNFSFIVPLNAGEYAEMHAYQDSGTSLNALGGASFYTSFQCTYLGA